jgi:hypothetical protein
MTFVPWDGDAYEVGKRRRIMANAYKGRGQRFDAQYPGLRDRILANARVLPDWMVPALNKWNGLTEKQAAVAIRILDTAVERAQEWAIKENDRRDRAEAWTPGRQEVEGEITYVAWRATQWGMVLKATVAVGDKRLWVTVPEVVIPPNGEVQALKGTTLKVRVTVKPSDKDPTFGFGSRPTVINP